MFWMRNKENRFSIRTLIWRPGYVTVCLCPYHVTVENRKFVFNVAIYLSAFLLWVNFENRKFVFNVAIYLSAFLLWVNFEDRKFVFNVAIYLSAFSLWVNFENRKFVHKFCCLFVYYILLFVHMSVLIKTVSSMLLIGNLSKMFLFVC